MGDEDTRIVRTVILMASVALLAFCLCMMGELSNVKGADYYPELSFERGDINGDGLHCFDDPVFLLYHLYRDGRPLPCEAAADVDGNQCIDINDVLYSLRWLFQGDVYMTGSIPARECKIRQD